jgi:hypothetical protein
MTVHSDLEEVEHHVESGDDEGDRSDDDNDNDDAQFQRPTRPKNELNPYSLGFQQVCATTEKTCDIVS